MGFFYYWWRHTDLNRGHSGYEPLALANWAMPPEHGADDQDWTGDLILTKDALYHLSYISIAANMVAGAGLEPATFGLWARRATNCSTPRYWWREKDSNLRSQRRQIYSLLPLTTRESLHGLSLRINWSWQKELNPQPTDYKSVALPIELCQPLNP